MEHVSANTVVVHDLGEFITILGQMRVRKELISAYTLAGPQKDNESVYSVNCMINNGWNSCAIGTKEECNNEILRLDWVFKNAK